MKKRKKNKVPPKTLPGTGIIRACFYKDLETGTRKRNKQSKETSKVKKQEK